MAGRNVESKIEALLAPILMDAFELADVEFVKEGPNWYLRVYIDKEGGISIDDCEMISKELEKKLDETDPIEQAYILEVSSPGLDRPLKKDSDFVKYEGELIDIKLYRPKNGKKEFQGQLLGYADGVVSILLEGGEKLDFTKKEIASIRLAVIF